jgi:hypothetical protein
MVSTQHLALQPHQQWCDGIHGGAVSNGTEFMEELSAMEQPRRCAVNCIKEDCTHAGFKQKHT